MTPSAAGRRHPPDGQGSSDRAGLPIWADINRVRGQPRPARRGAAIVLLALLGPQGTLLLLRTEPRLDVVLRSATVHLAVVSAISACALPVAVAAAVAAGRSRDGSLVLLALGCLAVGFLMLGHGLTIPGSAAADACHNQPQAALVATPPP